MTKEELAQRIGADRADWQIYGHKKDRIGVHAWKGAWSDGNRFPLATVGVVTDDEWQVAIDWLKARVPT